MERQEMIQFAINTMNLESTKVKKMNTNRLTKLVEEYKLSHPEPVIDQPKRRRGRPCNPNKAPKKQIVRGNFILGWNTPDGNIIACKYWTLDFKQTFVDSGLYPEKFKKVHVYKKESTAYKMREVFQNSNPELYKGLEVISL